MNMKLHWSPRSPYVRKVVVAAHELKLFDQLELVRSVAAMLKPNAELMLDNPLSKIPTLVLADGTNLFDSVVIIEYLNTLAGGPLFPAEGAAKWQSLRWHALGDGLLENLILWRNERERSAPLPVLIGAFDTKVQACLNLLDAEVSALAAAPLAIGHIAIGCGLGYIDFRFGDMGWRKSAPALGAWHDEMMKRPSFIKTEAAEG